MLPKQVLLADFQPQSLVTPSFKALCVVADDVAVSELKQGRSKRLACRGCCSVCADVLGCLLW